MPKALRHSDWLTPLSRRVRVPIGFNAENPPPAGARMREFTTTAFVPART
jgi:hypothetical protein